MEWMNSSLVTSDLFLDLELLMHQRTAPSLQTILNLNEALELVVLNERLLMPSTDHIVILKNLNRHEIEELGGNEAINWEYELKHLGRANLKKPVITVSLIEDGALVLDTQQPKNKEFREFGNILYSQQWNSEWILKTIGVGIKDPKLKRALELSYVGGFNKTFEQVSSDPLYWRMAILAAPDLAPHFKNEFGYDYSWTYRFYKEIEIYAKFAKRKRLGFNDTVFMQPFVALNFQPSDNFIDVFYRRLKNVRNKEIKQFLELQKSWVYRIPPLTAILLQRCKTLTDLPVEMLKLRKEFRDLRESLTKYQKMFDKTDTLKDKIQLKKEFENSVNLFMRKAERPRKRIIKTIIDFISQQSDSIINQDFGGPVKGIIGKLGEYISHKRLYPWTNSFLHLYDKSLEIRSDVNLYEKLFGPVNLDYINEFDLFAQNSQKLLENS